MGGICGSEDLNMMSAKDYATLEGPASDQCFNLSELRELGEKERAFLEDTARNIESVILNAKISALESGLEMGLAQKGLITSLIVTTASFAALYSKSQANEAQAFYSIMRCMAEALIDVSKSAPRARTPQVRNYRSA